MPPCPPYFSAPDMKYIGVPTFVYGHSHKINIQHALLHFSSYHIFSFFIESKSQKKSQKLLVTLLNFNQHASTKLLCLYQRYPKNLKVLCTVRYNHLILKVLKQKGEATKWLRMLFTMWVCLKVVPCLPVMIIFTRRYYLTLEN